MPRPSPAPRPLLDYDAEAEAYDATRGGAPRAEAAAAAVLGLLPPAAATLLDLGCGTGIVTTRIAAARPGLRVIGADASYGMAAMARSRGVPVALASGTRLPFRSGSLDAVSAVWLLHLLRSPGLVAAVIAEAGRVLRPGGLFVTTVDKDAAHDAGSDIDAVLAEHLTATPADSAQAVTGHAAAVGLYPAGETLFTGHGQGRTPRGAAEALLAGRYASRVHPRGITPRELADRLELLPGPDTPRAEPTYRLRGFVRA